MIFWNMISLYHSNFLITGWDSFLLSVTLWRSNLLKSQLYLYKTVKLRTSLSSHFCPQNLPVIPNALKNTFFIFCQCELMEWPSYKKGQIKVISWCIICIQADVVNGAAREVFPLLWPGTASPSSLVKDIRVCLY